MHSVAMQSNPIDLSTSAPTAAAPRVLLVSRHPGAIEWMRRVLQVRDATELAHLPECDVIRPGDLVFGVLPVRWIAAIRAAGARAFSIEVVLPPHCRGQELSSDQLDTLVTRLVEYDATALGEGGPATLGELTLVKTVGGQADESRYVP